MMQKKDNMQKRREQLEFRRKIAILSADLRKAEKEQQSFAMELRRTTRKRAQIDAQIASMKKGMKKSADRIRILQRDLRTQQKRLNRIS